jgi:hypothetical protein
MGLPASMPTWATRPGCRSSALESEDPAALRPRPEKLSKTIRARLLKLPTM